MNQKQLQGQQEIELESSHIDHIAFIDSGMMAHKYWLSSFKFNYEKNFIR